MNRFSMIGKIKEKIKETKKGNALIKLKLEDNDKNIVFITIMGELIEQINKIKEGSFILIDDSYIDTEKTYKDDTEILTINIIAKKISFLGDFVNLEIENEDRESLTLDDLNI